MVEDKTTARMGKQLRSEELLGQKVEGSKCHSVVQNRSLSNLRSTRGWVYKKKSVIVYIYYTRDR